MAGSWSPLNNVTRATFIIQVQIVPYSPDTINLDHTDDSPGIERMMRLLWRSGVDLVMSRSRRRRRLGRNSRWIAGFVWWGDTSEDG